MTLAVDSEAPPSPRAPVIPLRPGDGSNDWRDRLVYRTKRDGSRTLEEVASNAITILRNDPSWRDVVAYDELAQTITTLSPPKWEPDEAPAETLAGPWTAADTVRLQGWLLRRWALKLGPEAVDASLLVAAEAKRIDPVREYLEGLRWDAGARIGRAPSQGDEGAVSWLTTYLGAEDTPYTRHVGRWFMISAVARAYAPGCKVDTVPILEGLQGRKKGTALRALFEPWFSDTPVDVTSKDRFGSIAGIWCKELAEFDGYRRHEASIMKAFVSSQADKFRPPYARRDIIAPRRSVFVATINPAGEYLQDETGGRRWWPIKVAVTQHIDVIALARDKPLLWAEARELYQSHMPWWPIGEENDLCREEQAGRQARDAWEDPISFWLHKPDTSDHVTIGDVLGGALGLEKQKWDQQSQTRAGRCIRLAGWERVQVRERDGRRRYVYQRAAVE